MSHRYKGMEKLGMCLRGGGGCCVFIRVVGTRADTSAEGHPWNGESLRTRPYLKRQPSCAALWSRRRPRSTSLSWGSLCESLYRSHSWRWSGYSPDRRSERVRPGQPWLPVYHTIARITSPSEGKLRLDESTRWPLFSPLRSPASESSDQAAAVFFLSFHSSSTDSLLSKWRSPRNVHKTPTVRCDFLALSSCVRCTFHRRRSSSTGLSPYRHVSTGHKAATYGCLTVYYRDVSWACADSSQKNK